MQQSQTANTIGKRTGSAARIVRKASTMLYLKVHVNDDADEAEACSELPGADKALPGVVYLLAPLSSFPYR